MSIPTPAELGLPAHFTTFRSHQVEALERIIASPKRIIMLDAPTGSGKTLIAAAAARLLNLRAFYTCSTKSLQDQFSLEFPYVRVLKGRANYPTLHEPKKWPMVSCDDCTGTSRGPCKHCAEELLDDEGQHRGWTHERCPYRVAKREAVASELACLNTSLFLLEANNVGEFSGWPLGIIDEADMLEGELMKHVELMVGRRWAERFGLLGGPKKKTRPPAWLRWAQDALEVCGENVRIASFRTPKEERNAKQVLDRLQAFVQAIEQEKPFVNCTQSSDHETGPWVFRPVHVAEYGPEMLWRHADRWLLMSATFLGADVYCRDLGISRADVEWVSLPNTFPVDRRPVYYRPTVALNHQTEDFGALTECVVDVCKGEGPVLVHTVSYRLAEIVCMALKEAGVPYVTYRKTDERQIALDRFKARGGVLVAPSMERGVDLPDDLCRAVVIAKVPYPSLGDKQVSVRLYGTSGGPEWYAAQTIRSIIQASGRGMRSADDQCETWILDGQFAKVLSGHKRLFPAWFREALWLVNDKGNKAPML